MPGSVLNRFLVQMDDFSKPGLPNHFGLWPSPCKHPSRRDGFLLSLVLDNYPAPGKRPLSSVSPVIMEDSDGNFQVALGAAGGSRIFPSVFQTILGLDWGLDISQAVEFPRLHDQLFPTVVEVDNGYPDEGIQALVDRGHNVSGEKFSVTQLHSLQRDSFVLQYSTSIESRAL
jgi:gamma-glutamyltranspeptidase/glutathione hydrolase/leukotriene-C4 hydrolase